MLLMMKSTLHTYCFFLKYIQVRNCSLAQISLSILWPADLAGEELLLWFSAVPFALPSLPRVAENVWQGCRYRQADGRWTSGVLQIEHKPMVLHGPCMTNSACLLATWQMYVLVASCQGRGFAYSTGTLCHIAMWQSVCFDHTLEDALDVSVVVLEEEAWPTSAENAGFVTFLAACGRLQKHCQGKKFISS